MTGPLYGVYGAGGCGRGIMPIARETLSRQGVPLDRLVFVVDQLAVPEINGHPVMTFAEFQAVPAVERHVAIAIADSQVRQRLAETCQSAGVKLWSLTAANVVVMDDVTIGDGALLSPFVTLTSNIRIGVAFHANLYSYVEHDCVIGDYVTFAPGVKCNGNVRIEDHAYIGTGAILKQGKPSEPLVISRGAVVGMGAVVTKSVPAGATVVGNPAKPLERKV